MKKEKATQLIEKAVLTPEEAKWFEKNKHLPFVDRESGTDFYNEVYLSSYYWTFYDDDDYDDNDDRDAWMECANRLYKAYFNGYVINENTKFTKSKCAEK